MTIEVKDKWLWIGLGVTILLVIGIYAGWKIAGALSGGGGIVGGIVGYSKREQRRREEARKIITDSNKKIADVDKRTQENVEKIDQGTKDKIKESNDQAAKEKKNVPKNDDDFSTDLDNLADKFNRTKGKPIDS